MSPLEQGGLFHPEQGTGLSEAPPAAEETLGEDLGVFSVAAGVYRPREDWHPDPLPPVLPFVDSAWVSDCTKGVEACRPLLLGDSLLQFMSKYKD